MEPVEGETPAIGRPHERRSAKDPKKQGDRSDDADGSSRPHERAQHIGSGICDLSETEQQTQADEAGVFVARIRLRIRVIHGAQRRRQRTGRLRGRP